MAAEWYKMQASTLGGYEDQEFQDWHESFENDILTTFPHAHVLIYGDRMTNTPVEADVVIQAVTEDSYNTMQVRQILAPIGTIMNGDLILVDDRWWIVLTLVDNNKVYEKAILKYCNVMLNFTSPITLQTVTYPVNIHNATQYNSGEKYSQNAVYTSSQKLIYMPYNEETVLLDNDYRFLIDRNTVYPSAWKIANTDTENDYWGERGLVRIMAVEDEVSLTDDKVNMIADNTKWLAKRFGAPGGLPTGGGWID